MRLSDVADIGPERSSNLITRENAQRKAVISLNVAEGSNLGDLVAQVQERVDPIVQEAGMTVSYGGQFEAQQSASRTILVAGVAVALIMIVRLFTVTPIDTATDNAAAPLISAENKETVEKLSQLRESTNLEDIPAPEGRFSPFSERTWRTDIMER